MSDNKSMKLVQFRNDIQKYMKPDHYPAIEKIADVAKHKCKSLRVIAKHTTVKETKQMVFLAVMQYVCPDVLPLTPVHVKMVVNWIVSEYNPETQEGGAMGYSIEDLHIIFRMGLTGRFGVPSGHKYVMPQIIGKKGWFEQYHEVRNEEMHVFYHNKNLNMWALPAVTLDKDKKIIEKSKDIPCPPEYKIDISKIETVGKKVKKYTSIKEFCEAKGYDYEIEMKPYWHHWKEKYKEMQLGGDWTKHGGFKKVLEYEDFVGLEQSLLLNRINGGLIVQSNRKPAKRDKAKYGNKKLNTSGISNKKMINAIEIVTGKNVIDDTKTKKS